jgi:hypothetical protein
MSQDALPRPVWVLVFSSALVHALWNGLLARVPRGFETMTVGNALGFLAWAPLALTRWRVDGDALTYLLLSAAFQVSYFVVLNLAYARVPAHAAYPVARGLAPVPLLTIAVLAGARVPAWARRHWSSPAWRSSPSPDAALVQWSSPHSIISSCGGGPPETGGPDG